MLSERGRGVARRKEVEAAPTCRTYTASAYHRLGPTRIITGGPGIDSDSTVGGPGSWKKCVHCELAARAATAVLMRGSRGSGARSNIE